MRASADTQAIWYWIFFAYLVAAVQRLKSVVATGRTHANRHKAVAGFCDLGTHEGQLHKVLGLKNLCTAAAPHR